MKGHVPIKENIVIEEIIRDTLREYSYGVSEACIASLASRIEAHLDDVGWTAVE